MAPIRKGDGTPIVPKGIQQVRTGDGRVLFDGDAIPDSEVYRWAYSEGTGTNVAESLSGNTDADISYTGLSWESDPKYEAGVAGETNGTDQYGSTNSVSVPWDSADGFSIVFSIESTTTSDTMPFSYQEPTGNGDSAVYIRTNDAGFTTPNIVFTVTPVGGAQKVVDEDTEFLDGDLHTVGISFRPSDSIDLYINGFLVNSTTITENHRAAPNGVLYHSTFANSVGDFLYDGIVDLPIINDSALSTAEHADEYDRRNTTGDVFTNITENITFRGDFGLLSGTGGGQGIRMKDDGTRYWIPRPGDAEIQAYDMSTPWNISTSSFTHALDISAVSTDVQTPGFNNDGTKMYVPFLNQEIVEYDLSTAYDITTATQNQTLTINYEAETHPIDVEWNSDGTKVLIGAGQEDDFTEWTASTPFDITSISFVQAYDAEIDTAGDKVKSMRLADGGTQIFSAHNDPDYQVYRWSLADPYDLTAVTFEDTFDVSSRTNGMGGAEPKPDGSALFVNENSGQRILQYE